ncbi:MULTISPECIES: family 43 glycosylhydrolase [Streptomyces]|uniref:Beta-xylosidase n=1 Tax=Streptomyces scabiei TaxID=1930 RepID=A0A100JQC5_STRSC|nr:MULTISPECIES: family 43 glycosylhydrolase [Streptomyces]MDX3069567.1 family 43 glycosylhydrolase [Streptomyces sp. ND04-05B]GAQ63754.1 beta-xylosidase [Streptomyces scabiei]
MDLTRRQLGRLAAIGTGALLLPGLLPSGVASAATFTEGIWGDQGDGTYANPIVPTDLSDWDCIRVGDDYYGITSTMGYSPGMAVLHSKDLVNWRPIGGAVDDVTRIGPELNWDRMNRYGRGVWAGAIRFHAGRYWVYFNTPDEGFFMTSAPSPEGPWEPLHSMWRTSGWNDVCPFWDDDGQGYLVTTHYSDGYKIHLYKLSEDGKSLIGPAPVIHQSNRSEASKLYKIDGVYYHLFSEVKPEGRVLMMNRGSSILGPFETRQLLHVNTSVDREPNQGGLVETPGGDWYFVTHHGSHGFEGRVLSLLPVTWVDGWPIIGTIGSDGVGNMAWTGQLPAIGTPGLPVDALPAVVTSDSFTDTRLKPQWEWYYQPRAGYWSLTERPGFLRLKAFAPLNGNNLMKVGNTLTQRVLRTAGGATVTVRLELDGLTDGQHAGLCHYHTTYAGLGVRRSGTTTTIEYNSGGTLTSGAAITQNAVWLRTTWDVNGVSRFWYSLDGSAFTQVGSTFQLNWGGYRGDRIGLYTYNAGATGYVDVDSVQYTIAPAPKYTCVSVRSGKVADVSGGSGADGAAVIQWPDKGATNQQWAFQSTADGYHTITCVGSGKVLDVAGSSTADAARVVQATLVDGKASQQWQLRPLSGGVFQVVNRNSGKVLDVASGSTADGAALIQYANRGSTNQQWRFRRVTG